MRTDRACCRLSFRSLRFAKRFFYFNDEPVEAKQLSTFHQNEKAAVANPIAAWASQTGKGLLFITKRAEDKAHPSSIINLVSASLRRIHSVNVTAVV